jgi:hypothetical protein
MQRSNKRSLSMICLAFAAFADAWQATAQSFWQQPARSRVRTTAPQSNLFGNLFGSPPSPPPTTMTREDSIAQAAKLGVQLPQYEVLRTGSEFEVRRYQRLQVVECAYEKRPEGYELLGGYAQRGENDAGLPMPATAPCLMSPLDAPKRMWYILPSPHTPLDPSADPVPPPAPLAADVLSCRDISPMVVAVGSFSGYAVPDVVFSRRDALANALAAEGIALEDGATGARLLLAQYNELFALPWNRENEVWLPVNPDSL